MPRLAGAGTTVCGTSGWCGRGVLGCDLTVQVVTLFVGTRGPGPSVVAVFRGGQ